jgi:uncharacterized protein
VVTEEGFEVGMSFGGIPERLNVPFAAVKGFFDPSVQFGLQFETVTEAQSSPGPKEVAASEAPAEDAKPRLKRKLAETDSPAAIGPAASAKSESAKPESTKPEPARSALEKPEATKPALVPSPDKPEPDKPSGGGAEVVRLDRFRKK